MLPPVRFLLVGGAGSKLTCLPQPTAGAAVELVCVALFPSSPGKESFWSGATCYQGCLHNEHIRSTLEEFLLSGQVGVGRSTGEHGSGGTWCEQARWRVFKLIPAGVCLSRLGGESGEERALISSFVLGQVS